MSEFRRLLYAIEHCTCGCEKHCPVDDVLDEARAYEKTRGWKKWPENKPEISKTSKEYLVYCKPPDDNPDYIYCATLSWGTDKTDHWNEMEVVGWQPFPPLPEIVGQP
jgi:hypothetical protein